MYMIIRLLVPLTFLFVQVVRIKGLRCWRRWVGKEEGWVEVRMVSRNPSRFNNEPTNQDLELIYLSRRVINI